MEVRVVEVRVVEMMVRGGDGEGGDVEGGDGEGGHDEQAAFADTACRLSVYVCVYVYVIYGDDPVARDNGNGLTIDSLQVH